MSASRFSVCPKFLGSSFLFRFFCEPGYSRLGSTSRRCKCKRNNCRWTGNSDQICAKSYQKSPCLIGEGGCAWKCIDRGDGVPQCLCPCRYKLASDGRSCELDSDHFCPVQLDVQNHAKMKLMFFYLLNVYFFVNLCLNCLIHLNF